MAEKLAEVYEKYDMEVLGTRRGRGATIITTMNGVHILEPFHGSIVRLEQENVLKNLFVGEGFRDMDLFLPNKEGELLTYDRYRQPYVLKKHFEGEECDMRNVSNVVRAVEKLADFHIVGKKVAGVFQTEWERSKCQKERQHIQEIRQVVQDGEELERVAQMYGMTLMALMELLKEQAYAEEFNALQAYGAEYGEWVESEREQKTQQQECVGNDQQDNRKTVLETFVRRNRELRKIRRFVGKVKGKNDFENLFLKVFPEYYNLGKKCEDSFDEVLQGEDKLDVKDVVKNHYGICHGNYNQHNILLSDKSEAIVHWERFSRGNQLEDLYQFARKVMEKNHFDYEILEILLNTYARRIELSKEDYRYIYVLFSYPEKFWKIANSYYNTNKAFLSPKYIEKLETVIQQEKEKAEMLSQFLAFHL